MERIHATLTAFAESVAPELCQIIQFAWVDEDWLVKVEHEVFVTFNLALAEATSIEFCELVCIHEFIHVLKNNIPNKEDVKMIDDAFMSNGFAMRLIDVWADVEAAYFIQVRNKLSFRQYLGILFQGGLAFRDKWRRPLKFDRWISSIVSVYRTFRDGSPMVFMISSTQYNLNGFLTMLHSEGNNPPRLCTVQVNRDMLDSLNHAYSGRLNQESYVMEIIGFLQYFNQLFDAKVEGSVPILVDRYRDGKDFSP